MRAKRAGSDVPVVSTTTQPMPSGWSRLSSAWKSPSGAQQMHAFPKSKTAWCRTSPAAGGGVTPCSCQ